MGRKSILIIGSRFNNKKLTEDELINKAKRDGFDPNYFKITWLVFSNNLNYSQNSKVLIKILPIFSPTYLLIPLFYILNFHKFFKLRKFLIVNDAIFFIPIFLTKIFGKNKCIFLFSGFISQIYRRGHGVNGFLFSYFYKINEFFLFKSFNYIICISKSSYEYVINYTSKSKVYLKYPNVFGDYLIKNEVNSDFIRKKYDFNNTNKVILSIGRLEKVKRFDKLIELFSTLDSNYRLLIIGSGSQKESLMKLIKKLNLGERVKLEEHLEHNLIWNYYKTSDLFVLLSQSESLGLVIIEAMKSNLPCIGFNVGGIKDSLSESRGVLIDNLDEFSFKNAIYDINLNKNKYIRNAENFISNQFIKNSLNKDFYSFLFNKK